MDNSNFNQEQYNENQSAYNNSVYAQYDQNNNTINQISQPNVSPYTGYQNQQNNNYPMQYQSNYGNYGVQQPFRHQGQQGRPYNPNMNMQQGYYNNYNMANSFYGNYGIPQSYMPRRMMNNFLSLIAAVFSFLAMLLPLFKFPADEYELNNISGKMPSLCFRILDEVFKNISKINDIKEIGAVIWAFQIFAYIALGIVLIIDFLVDISGTKKKCLIFAFVTVIGMFIAYGDNFKYIASWISTGFYCMILTLIITFVSFFTDSQTLAEIRNRNGYY